MAHLKEEEIASMAEGKVKGPDHDRFLKHLSECETCFKVYTNTMKFVEEERKRTAWWRKFRLPDVKRIREWLRFPGLHSPFPVKVLIPAAAVLIAIVLSGIYIMNELNLRNIRTGQMQHLTRIATQIEDSGIQSFAGTKGEIMSACRSGVFLEDILLLEKVKGQDELATKIRSWLIEELKTLTIGKDDLFREVVQIERNNCKGIIKFTKELLNRYPYSDLFQFGRFVEKSILATYKNRNVKMDINTYLLLIREYNLPPGVAKELQKVNATLDGKKIREIFINIKEVFLFSK